MRATFYIHIGVPKTGTTSIQSTMFKNRDSLLARGVNYLPLHANHGPFLVSLLHDNPHQARPNIRRYVDTPEKAAAYNARNRERLIEIFSGNRSPKVAISGEALSGLPANAVQDLKNLCDPYAADYRIIVYVRDPYEYANSAFLQHLKDGITLSQPGVIPLPKYRSKIEKYIKVFGRENVNIRVFAPHRFAGGNLISDFMTALDEPAAAADGMHITRANEALSHEAAIILSQANEAIPVYVDGRANRARAYGFHARLFGVKGEKFSVDPDVYLKHKADILADIEWLHRCAGESIFGDPALREPSRPRWSVDTVESIKQAVRDMVSTIRKLQSAPRPGIWQSLFQKRSEVPWRSLEKKDFSQALPSDLDDVVVPAELEWLREAISQRNAPQESIVPQFDEATIRSLACFIHSLALTIERLKAARAARPSLLRRLGIGR